MASGTTKTLSLLLIFFFAATAAIASSLRSTKARAHDDDTCVYTIYIRTGSIWKGGTDSKISLTLAASDGWGVEITDLEDWGGLMGEGYNYFERGNLDIFSGRAPCLSGPLCWLNLTSDGSGEHHGWYCNYVEVTTTGPHLGCFQRQFTIEQWLATDTSPYKLYATVDYCSSDDDGVSNGPRLLRPAVAGRKEKLEFD
ncbi:PLAT domain-containing protein 3-like [Phalaenopsis equestris]|uniref:PLAT domain-containing protein 3-like n=1 Tax=Phalaenopsis equestris TaxID=78828 RepID=UPI0009E3BD6F|nr:PLAT domain-containing protein 3-like [Phalaenopsis equestris]